MQDLAGFFLPAGCVTCGTWIPEARGAPPVCARCRSRFAEPPWPRCTRCHFPRGTGRAEEADCGACRAWPSELAQARYAFELRPPATDVVHALKYEGWRELARVMGPYLASAHRPSSGALLTYVPTTERRVRTRGYNQARLLAEAYGAELGMPVVRLLERRGAKASQTTLHPSERLANVEDAFHPSARVPRRSRGAPVVLVDDVLTTGATASAAARRLAAAGLGPVTLVVFARALPDAARRGP